MIVIGINAFHGDSAGAITVDGELIAAAEEERFRRIKHWAGFPSMSIAYCLEEAGVTLGDVDVVAINSNPNSGRWRKLKYVFSGQAGVKLIVEKIRIRRKRMAITEYFDRDFGKDNFNGRFVPVEHHYAHLASCYLVSPFNEAVAVSIDGFGDFCSTAWGLGRQEQLSLDDRIYFPHSLGVFYQAMTQYLGFHKYGDEYKVMGLASYGRPRFLQEMQKIVRLQDDGKFSLNLDYFQHHQRQIGYEWTDCEPTVGTLYSDKLVDLLGAPRTPESEISQQHQDIASSIQWMYEHALMNLLKALYERYHVKNLTLAGGCAMNSVANGKILGSTPFAKAYIQPAAGDAGGAIGAAMAVVRDHDGKPGKQSHAYLGPSYSNTKIRSITGRYQREFKETGSHVHQIHNEEKLVIRVVEELVEGRVVGWFQDRMEWGPRALGNRSILCDPRRDDIRDILNLKIKRRESFRPFAPSILRESVKDWFETDDDVPFMMKVYKVKESKRDVIPAVTHVDGTGRLQTVERDTNALYYDLISEFENTTGVPILLNTSFNENEPIVCRPEEALECYLRTKMDVLVLGEWFINRDVA